MQELSGPVRSVQFEPGGRTLRLSVQTDHASPACTCVALSVSDTAFEVGGEPATADQLLPWLRANRCRVVVTPRVGSVGLAAFSPL